MSLSYSWLVFLRRGRKEAIAENKRSDENRNIGEIKNSGSEAADSNTQKVNDATVVQQSIDKVAASSADYQGERDIITRCCFIVPQKIEQAADQKHRDTDGKKKKTPVFREIINYPQKTAMVLDKSKFEKTIDCCYFVAFC